MTKAKTLITTLETMLNDNELTQASFDNLKVMADLVGKGAMPETVYQSTLETMKVKFIADSWQASAVKAVQSLTTAENQQAYMRAVYGDKAKGNDLKKASAYYLNQYLLWLNEMSKAGLAVLNIATADTDNPKALETAQAQLDSEKAEAETIK